MNKAILANIIISVFVLAGCDKKLQAEHFSPLTYPNAEISIQVNGRISRVLVSEKPVSQSPQLKSSVAYVSPVCIGMLDSGNMTVKYELVGPTIYAKADIYVFIVYIDGKEVEKVTTLYKGTALSAIDREDVKVKIQPVNANKPGLEQSATPPSSP